MPTARLISFVGTGNYQPVRYVWEARGGEAEDTKHVSLALTRLVQPAETVLLATQKAKKCQDDLPAAYEAAGLSAPRFVDIPDGKDQAELWRIFDICRTHMDPPDGVQGETVVDITHGFRSQPFLAGAAAAFSRLTRAPDNDRTVTLVYGAFEAKDAQGQAPIIDLTSFVDIIDWAQAIMLFLRTGRGRDLVRLTRKESGLLHDRWEQQGSQGGRPGLSGLNNPLEAFTADLATLRTGSLLLPNGTAQKLKAKIDQLEGELGGHPALASILHRLRDMAAELILPDGVDTLAGIGAKPVLVALARRYLEMERYSEAVATVREGLISLYAPPAAGQPGPRFSTKERVQAECRWRKHDKKSTEQGKLRNDLLHAGYNDGPVKGLAIATRVTLLVNHFADVNASDTSIVDKPIFLNLSNHPSTDWEEAQREAALALAKEIHDRPFPPVPPDADEAAIDGMAMQLEAQIPDGTTHAMIQGEFTLAFALVRRLSQRGIICLAATTDRDVETEADGARRYRFRFVRFREYPT